MLDPNLPKNIIDRVRDTAHLFVNLLLPSLPTLQAPAQGPGGSGPITQPSPGGGSIKRVGFYPQWVAPTGTALLNFTCPSGYTLKTVFVGDVVNGYSCLLNGAPDQPKPSSADTRYV